MPSSCLSAASCKLSRESSKAHTYEQREQHVKKKTDIAHSTKSKGMQAQGDPVRHLAQ